MALELQSGGSKFCVVSDRDDLPLCKVSLSRISQGEEAFHRVELGSARPTLSVGVPCRVYARLLGRLPNVHSATIDQGVWYRVGGKGACYFFKLDDPI